MTPGGRAGQLLQAFLGAALRCLCHHRKEGIRPPAPAVSACVPHFTSPPRLPGPAACWPRMWAGRRCAGPTCLPMRPGSAGSRWQVRTGPLLLQPFVLPAAWCALGTRSGCVLPGGAVRAQVPLASSLPPWLPPPRAAACIAELDALSAAVAAGAPQLKAAAAAAAGGGASAATQSAHKWNVLPSAVAAKGGLGSSRQGMDALLAARCGYPRAALAARALAGFACASLTEDRFGVLQLTQVRLAIGTFWGALLPSATVVGASHTLCPLFRHWFCPTVGSPSPCASPLPAHACSRGWAMCWRACWARWARRSS